ncbi:co-chaperone GroES [Selenomonadales bacterium OttesenSCG-928-I06]|nr:co-chaperone GroES [Selenomonadales bacterium OttesenSCG-928-I06]
MIRPLGDRVVLETIAKEEVTASGIFIPDTAAKEKPQEGKVVAVGAGRVLESGQRIPLEVEVGDRVFFSKYAGNEIKVDDKEYLIINERDILAIF